MKQNILDQQVLVVNNHWVAVHAFTVRDAVSQMAAGASTGIDVGDDGSLRTVTWDEWITLPIRKQDSVLHTKFLQVRCPTVVACASYGKIPKKAQKFTLANIARRDGYKDVYTGEVLKPEDWSLDHIDPRGQGGANTVENVGLQKKTDNWKKGCRTPEQAGLRRPKVRPLLPQSPVETIVMTHPDHAHFVKPFKEKH